MESGSGKIIHRPVIYTDGINQSGKTLIIDIYQ